MDNSRPKWIYVTGALFFLAALPTGINAYLATYQNTIDILDVQWQAVTTGIGMAVMILFGLLIATIFYVISGDKRSNRWVAYCIAGMMIITGYTANLTIITPNTLMEWVYALFPFSISLASLYIMKVQLQRYFEEYLRQSEI